MSEPETEAPPPKAETALLEAESRLRRGLRYSHRTGLYVSLVVAIVNNPSWVLVTSSAGAQVYQGVLQPGAQMHFSDPASLTVRFGNASDVMVSVNGKPSAPPCQQDVCTVQFTRTSNTAG